MAKLARDLDPRLRSDLLEDNNIIRRAMRLEECDDEEIIFPDDIRIEEVEDVNHVLEELNEHSRDGTEDEVSLFLRATSSGDSM